MAPTSIRTLQRLREDAIKKEVDYGKNSVEAKEAWAKYERALWKD